MSIINKLTLFNITFFTSCLAISSPLIHEIQGDLADGKTVIISGKNFTVTDAETLLWDDIDNQNGIKNGVKVPTGQNLTWGENGSPWASSITFDTTKKRTSRSASYAGKAKSYLKWPNKIKSKNLQNIYVSWWFKPDLHPYNNGGSNKVIRIWDDPDGNDTRISWTTMHLQSTGASTSWGSWGGKTGQWNRFEIWANSETGQLKTWVNGKLTHNKKDFKKIPSAHGFNIYLIGFDPSEPERYPGFTFNISDIYVSPSIARVEITNKATWEDTSATREIQPINSWSNDEVSFTLNAGSFNSLDNKYIYIIDKDGNVNNNGYLLCAKCPIAPELGVE